MNEQSHACNPPYPTDRNPSFARAAMSRVLGQISFVLAFLGFLSNLLALGLPYWQVAPGGVCTGLWRRCNADGCFEGAFPRCCVVILATLITLHQCAYSNAKRADRAGVGMRVGDAIVCVQRLCRRNLGHVPLWLHPCRERVQISCVVVHSRVPSSGYAALCAWVVY